MSESLFVQLKNLGLDEELASQVSASLSPEYNASKKDILVMQEAMLQLQARGDERHNQFQKEMADLQARSDQKMADLQARSDQKMAELQAKGDARHNQLQKEMADLQAKGDARYYKLKIENTRTYTELKTDIQNVRSELKTEIHTTINRQYLVTFGSALLTIASVLAVNWYYHI